MGGAEELAAGRARWRTSGLAEDLAALLRSRVRAGELAEEDLLVAALAGVEGAALALGADAPAVPTGVEDRLRALAELGGEVAGEAAAAMVAPLRGVAAPLELGAGGDHRHRLEPDAAGLLTAPGGEGEPRHRLVPERGRTNFVRGHAHRAPWDVLAAWAEARVDWVRARPRKRFPVGELLDLARVVRGALRGRARVGAGEPRELADVLRVGLGRIRLGEELPARAGGEELAPDELEVVDRAWWTGDTGPLAAWRLARRRELEAERARAQADEGGLAGFLKAHLGRWYAAGWSLRDGAATEDVVEAELRLGRCLPRVLREWYWLVGARLAQDGPAPFVPPGSVEASEWVDPRGRRVLVHHEDRFGWDVYLVRESLGEDDPRCWLSVPDDVDLGEDLDLAGPALGTALPALALAQTGRAAGGEVGPGGLRVGPFGPLREGVVGRAEGDAAELAALPPLEWGRGFGPGWLELRGAGPTLGGRLFGRTFMAWAEAPDAPSRPRGAGS